MFLFLNDDDDDDDDECISFYLLSTHLPQPQWRN